jgi:hypothetical protein
MKRKELVAKVEMMNRPRMSKRALMDASKKITDLNAVKDLRAQKMAARDARVSAITSGRSKHELAEGIIDLMEALAISEEKNKAERRSVRELEDLMREMRRA